MSANFWLSSHCQEWLRNPAEDRLTSTHIEKTERNRSILTDEEVKKLRVHLSIFISNLGKHHQVRCRQRVISTATVYLARFYYNNSYRDFHPHLIAATAVYLASKVEESPIQPNKIAAALKDLSRWAGKYSVNDIVDGEYFLMEELKFDLIVFHPYRPLQQYLSDAGMENIVSTAWYLVNDSDFDREVLLPEISCVYRLDLCLQYPPHITAIAAICIAGTYREQFAAVNSWFTERLNFNPEHRQQVKVSSSQFAKVRMQIVLQQEWSEALNTCDTSMPTLQEVEEALLEMYEEYSHLEPDEIQELLDKVPNPSQIGGGMDPPPSV